jgi:hypothetical protein
MALTGVHRFLVDYVIEDELGLSDIRPGEWDELNVKVRCDVGAEGAMGEKCLIGRIGEYHEALLPASCGAQA